MPNNQPVPGIPVGDPSHSGPEIFAETPTEQCICAEKSPYPFVWEGEQRRGIFRVPFPIQK